MGADCVRSRSLALAVLAVGLAGEAQAGISTDGTVGPRLRLDGPGFAIGAELGTRAGSNLFHSFENFSLDAGERATFSGPDAIRNIIGRVTGGQRSDIDGTIASSIPGADLYLINPAGVVFGPNAALDVRGSFHVSTADELRLEGGSVFSATDPAASSFTVAAPEAFGFLGAAPRGIAVGGSTLEVPTGETLSLIAGGVVVFDGGRPEGALLRAEAGAVEMRAVSGPGAARPGAGVAGGAGGGEVLIDGSAIDASGDGGGTVVIEGGRVRVGRSLVLAVNSGSADATGGITIGAGQLLVQDGSLLAVDPLATGAGGQVAVDADAITVAGGSQLRAVAAGEGDAGSVGLRADTVRLEDGGLVIASTRGAGRGGAVEVAAGRLQIARDDAAEATGILVQANSGSTGDAGTIEVRAGTVTLERGGVLSATTFAAGDGGRVDVTAARLRISSEGTGRFTGIAGDAGEDATGDAGRIEIDAGTVEIAEGGVISTDTAGQGRGGTVSLQASRLHLDGGEAGVATRISSDGSPGSTGDGGSVTIGADQILIERGSQVRTEADGAGRGGVMAIDAGRLVIRSGQDRFTGLSGLAQGDDGGDAGSIRVHADVVEVQGGGLIASSTVSRGDAGTIDIDAGRVRIDGQGFPSTGISSLAFPDAGDGGVIRVRAGEVRLLRGGVINTTTFGPGAGGRINVQADRLIIARSGGPFTGVSSSVETDATGDGGAVRVLAGDVALRAGGQIRSLTFGAGAAGRVDIRADRLSVADDAAAGLGSVIAPASIPFGITLSAILISAEPTETDDGLLLPVGGGGALRIDAGEIDLADGAVVSSSSFSPDQSAGNVLITADVLEMRGAAILTGAPFAGGGRITLLVGRRVDLADSWISSAVGGDQTSRAGDITIDPPFIVLDDSRIIAQANQGRGGNITLTVDNLIQSPDSLISASAGPAGIDGTVVVSTPEVDLSSGLVVLKGAPVETAPLRARCGARRDVGASSFTGVGRAALPPSPDAPLSSGHLDTALAAAPAELALPAAGPPAAWALPCTPRS